LRRPPTDCLYGLLNISNPQCSYKGGVYSVGDEIQDNCNTCTCQEPTESTDSCMFVLCSEDTCMTDTELLDRITRDSDTWVPTNYSSFWGVTLEEGVRGRLGARWPKPPESQMRPVHLRYRSSSLPSSWSWSGASVLDQGWCDNSWAVATLEVARQRISISSNDSIQMSARSVMDCQEVRCNIGGKTPGHAWNYVRRNGVHDLTCEAMVDKCDASGGCRNHQFMRGYRVGRTGRRMEDIMYEVITFGPVLAIIEVHRELFSYKAGVYQASERRGASEPVGYHAVRIVGWGQEGTGQKYWTVANTWGEDWGEGGLFRIKRGSNECRIEEMVTAAWPRGSSRQRRKRRRGGRRQRRS